MAYSQVPDESRIFTHKERKGIYFVVNSYDDAKGVYSWYYQDKKGVGDAGVDDVPVIEIMIREEGWKLYKTLHKEWFDPELEVEQKDGNICAGD